MISGQIFNTNTANVHCDANFEIANDLIDFYQEKMMMSGKICNANMANVHCNVHFSYFPLVPQ